MFNLKDIIRPSFRPGFDPPISSFHKPKIIRPARTISRNEPLGVRTQTFASDAPIPRQAHDFMRERRIKEQIEGVMVQLGPGTLSELLQVDIKDKNNPAIEVKKNVSLAELLQSQEGQLAGITSILEDFHTSAQSGSKLTRKEIGKLTALVAKAFSKGSRLSERDMATVLKTAGKIPTSPFSDLGITKNIITVDDIPDDYYGMFFNRIVDPRHMPSSDLTPEKPVFGIHGRPIKVKSFRARMRERYRLDLRKRVIMKPLEEKKEEKKEEGDEDEEDKEPDPMDEEEEESAGLHFDSPSPRAVNLGDESRDPAYGAFERARERERGKKGSITRSRSSPKKDISVAEAKRRAAKYKKKQADDKRKKKGFFSGMW